METLHREDILEIAKLAVNAIPTVAKKFGKGSYGGYLYVSDSTNRMLLHLRIGNPILTKDADYLAYSKEKAERLYWQTSDDLSWQSRSPNENQWGGAVRISKKMGFISFSGFPELADEAFCLALAVHTGFMADSTAYALTQCNNNSSLTEKMIDLVGDSVALL